MEEDVLSVFTRFHNPRDDNQSSIAGDSSLHHYAHMAG